MVLLSSQELTTHADGVRVTGGGVAGVVSGISFNDGNKKLVLIVENGKEVFVFKDDRVTANCQPNSTGTPVNTTGFASTAWGP